MCVCRPWCEWDICLSNVCCPTIARDSVYTHCFRSSSSFMTWIKLETAWWENYCLHVLRQKPANAIEGGVDRGWNSHLSLTISGVWIAWRIYILFCKMIWINSNSWWRLFRSQMALDLFTRVENETDCLSDGSEIWNSYMLYFMTKGSIWSTVYSTSGNGKWTSITISMEDWLPMVVKELFQFVQFMESDH